MPSCQVTPCTAVQLQMTVDQDASQKQYGRTKPPRRYHPTAKQKSQDPKRSLASQKEKKKQVPEETAPVCSRPAAMSNLDREQEGQRQQHLYSLHSAGESSSSPCRETCIAAHLTSETLTWNCRKRNTLGGTCNSVKKWVVIDNPEHKAR